MGWLARVPIAHRGLHDLGTGCPENSLSAFAKAIRAGFSIELDVHASADGEAIVFHDETLLRMTGQAGLLGNRHTAELTTLSLKHSNQRIPTLPQVLELVAGQVGLLIELKTEHVSDERLERRVADLLARYRGPVAIQSFKPDTIAWFHAQAPDLPRGQLAFDLTRGSSDLSRAQRRRLSDMDRLMRDGADFIGYHIKAMPRLALCKWRDLGLPVLAWTIRTPADLKRARRYADNIIFEGIRP
jgi:glycerophosphoryl diester phosphodiesterase